MVDDFLPPAEVERVRADINAVSQRQARLDKDRGGFNLEKASGLNTDPNAEVLRAGLLRKIQGAVFYVPAVKDVFTGPKMLDCMEDIMGPEIYYHSSKVMFKPARSGSAKPWHQDAAYWKNYLPNQVTVWIAIDDATKENGCVWGIPGSHKLGLIDHVKTELQVEESRIDLSQAQPVPVKSGGLLIFHSLVLHMSKKNESEKTRWAIICDYDPEANPCIDISFAPEDLDRSEFKGLREDNVWPLRRGKPAPVAVA